MRLRHVVFAFVLFGALVRGGAVAAGDYVPGAEWDRASAAESGWSEAGLAQARAFSNEIRSSAVFIVQHGKVVAEWGNTTKRTELASVRKSLLSASSASRSRNVRSISTVRWASSASTTIRLP